MKESCCRADDITDDVCERIAFKADANRCEEKEISIRIEGPNATMIHNKILDNSRNIIDDVGVYGFTIIIILARYQFGFDTSGQISTMQISRLTGIEERIVRGHCRRMAKHKYITQCDSDSWELNCN